MPATMDFPGLMNLLGGHQPTRILEAAVHHDLFTHLGRLEARVDGLAVPAAAVARVIFVETLESMGRYRLG